MSSKTISNLRKLAEVRAKNCLWLEAAQLYEKAATLNAKDAEHAELIESAGYCQSRASQQAKSLLEFKERRMAAVRAYRAASELFNQAGEEKRAKSNECRMLANYNAAWLASDPLEKKKALRECVGFGKKSATLYKETGDISSYGSVCTNLLRCLFEMLYVASDSMEMAETAQNGIEYADKAIKALTKSECRELLLEAYSLASLQSWSAAICEEPTESKELAKRCVSFSEKALELSVSTNDPYLVAVLSWSAAIARLFFTEEARASLEHARRMNEQAKVAKDRYLVGVSCYVLAQITNWMAVRETDSNKRKEWFNEVIEYAKDAIRYLQPLSQDFFVAQVQHLEAESLAILARSAEVGSKEKRAILEEAVDIGRAGVNNATRSGSPDAIGATLHALSKTLQFYSNFETKRSAKIALLEEALVHRQSYNEIVQKAFPANDWVVGVGKSYAGLIKRDLAELETEPYDKKKRLESAIADLWEGVSRSRKATLQRPIPTLIITVGGFEEGLADTLCGLYRLTKDDALLKNALEVDQNAAEDFRKINAPNRAAECCWRIAVNQNCLGDHNKASDSFTSAFKEYERAAKLMPDFAGFYLDYAAYMRAWSEIEKANFAHHQERYSDAVRHFHAVSSTLERSKLWSYFAPNFKAWAILEQGEALSRNEKTHEALEAFNNAAKLFKRARRVFERTISCITSLDEKEKAVELSKACLRRIDYCSARERIEAAKIDDRNGKHVNSANKYDSAASILEKMRETAENQIERKETATSAYMVRAWRQMKMADARASAELYSKASQLFSEAKKHGLKDRQILLASGNSAVCKALEHGTLFEERREKIEFTKAKKYLESASNFYLRAGLENASNWTIATEILLDAYNYLTDAETENNVSNKSKMLMLAERCLEQSAKFYESANYVGRRDEVLRIIAKVKQKREFTSSLGELLTTPEEASTTKAIPAPAPTIEEPVGLQKFERELIEVNLVAKKKNVLTAEGFSVELHVANLGKAPAFLTRVESMLPEGFSAYDESEMYTTENRDLNMRGKRLDPSKSESFEIGLRSLNKGVFEIKPKIFCVDETGRQVICEPEPLSINVTEIALPDRVATGYRDLDLLLLGGVPKNFAVLLASPPFDERAVLIHSFLESGARKGEATFHVAVDARGIENLAKQFKTYFHLFICNPRAEEIIKDMPNVFKLRGIENLTEISIALTSSLRNLESSARPRRVCLEIISDILLHHRAIITRKWLSALIPELRSHGFTTLAVLNPQMHPSQDVQAIMDIFDGEIWMHEKETRKGLQKFLTVRRLSNEKHLDSELPLKRMS